jgi:Fic family protein
VCAHALPVRSHPPFPRRQWAGGPLTHSFLCERGALSQPLLYLSAFFERYRDEYYHRLLAVSQTGNWRAWLEFFLRGVAVQAQEALLGANQILDLHARYRSMLGTKRVPQAALRLLDQLFINPVVAVAKLAQAWHHPFPTVQKGVARLVDLKILAEVTGQRRNRLFVAHELLDMLIPGADRSEREGPPDTPDAHTC